jgi:hypothetical protein
VHIIKELHLKQQFGPELKSLTPRRLGLHWLFSTRIRVEVVVVLLGMMYSQFSVFKFVGCKY